MIVSIPSAELYLWDVLTTISALYPEVVETEQAHARVITDGLSAGSFVRDPNGREVTLVTKANKQLFFDKMDEILKRK